MPAFRQRFDDARVRDRVVDLPYHPLASPLFGLWHVLPSFGADAIAWAVPRS